MRIARERLASWCAWVAAQLARGAGALHKFAKRQLEVPEQASRRALAQRNASPQAMVDEDFDEWEGFWRRMEGLAAAPWREELRHLGAEVFAKPARGQLRRAAASFSPYTGLGGDHLSPHWISWLTDELIDLLCQLLWDIEAAGRWPGQVRCILVHLIPKDAGGRRPIGLLATLARLWERVRAPLFKQWRASCARRYNWAAPGRNAERAAWVVSVTEEAALARDQASAASLLDLVKAFEFIPLELLWRKGHKHGCPMRLLALVLELCASPRRLVFRGALSQEVSSLTAVVAGLVTAVDLMFLAIVDALDEIATVYPCIMLLTYVDDITLHRVGTEGG